MSDIKAGLRYTKSDEWIKMEEDYVIIGITDYAQSHMGDIVFVEMKDPGITIKHGEVLTVIESVKSASDILAPLDGELIETNQELDTEPSLVNTDPYGKGWIAKIKLESKAAVEQLMDHIAYEEYRKE